MKLWEAFAVTADVDEPQARTIGREIGITDDELDEEVSDELVQRTLALKKNHPDEWRRRIAAAAAEMFSRN